MSSTKPWETEPDGIIWQRGEVWCIILRHPVTEILCGYVGFPYRYKDAMRDAEDSFDVHGGITYHKDNHIIRLPVKEQYFYLGFDCGHAWDKMPGLEKQFEFLGVEKLSFMEDAVYRDMQFVELETNLLADQVIKRIREAHLPFEEREED